MHVTSSVYSIHAKKYLGVTLKSGWLTKKIDACSNIRVFLFAVTFALLVLCIDTTATLKSESPGMHVYGTKRKEKESLTPRSKSREGNTILSAFEFMHFDNRA